IQLIVAFHLLVVALFLGWSMTLLTLRQPTFAPVESALAVGGIDAERMAPPGVKMAPPPSAEMRGRILDGNKSETASTETSSAAVRMREWFPETLLWRPEVVTDDQGRASIQVELADSITTWRLLASAVTADGQLGATQLPLRVFQPFFVDL